MKIPIQNIYYLLCYAWEKLEERDIVAVEGIETTTLADLFARVLINGTHHLLKRGFDRGYVPQHELTGRLRGRICFPEAVRRNATRSGRLPCDFDELSYNVLHNRILNATMRRLIRTEGLASESAEGLAQLCRQFSQIEDIEVTNRVFGQVQLYRNNQFYDFLLKVCELIHRNLLVSEASGAADSGTSTRTNIRWQPCSRTSSAAFTACTRTIRLNRREYDGAGFPATMPRDGCCRKCGPISASHPIAARSARARSAASYERRRRHNTRPTSSRISIHRSTSSSMNT